MLVWALVVIITYPLLGVRGAGYMEVRPTYFPTQAACEAQHAKEVARAHWDQYLVRQVRPCQQVRQLTDAEARAIYKKALHDLVEKEYQ
jgi:hypothetical protein